MLKKNYFEGINKLYKKQVLILIYLLYKW